ncbi:hypothetical protein [Sinimarinibacterium thermocellulolyticum]|uniref:hypothetical protein n=1 Tax=Sinimarinibacterium thermocellulolyticum TaxID=3170016 RepID=UPI003D9FB715
MAVFIDDDRADHGVGPICDVLPIAPSTHYVQAARGRDLRGKVLKLCLYSAAGAAFVSGVLAIHAEDLSLIAFGSGKLSDEQLDDIIELTRLYLMAAPMSVALAVVAQAMQMMRSATIAAIAALVVFVTKLLLLLLFGEELHRIVQIHVFAVSLLLIAILFWFWARTKE